jgi:hypothetical protein
MVFVQLANKERTHQLNSKFVKTYQIFFSKSYHYLILKENRSLFVLLFV